jgi:acetate kinase
MKILVLNLGSSSQNCCLFDLPKKFPEQRTDPLWETRIEWDGPEGVARVRARTAKGIVTGEKPLTDSHSAATEHLLRILLEEKPRPVSGPEEISVVGHRLVHGGPRLSEPAPVTSEVKEEIARSSVFAPLHNRAVLEGIEAVEKVLGNVRQVVVVDTGFHRHLPLAAKTYAGPYKWLERGIRRYGFHGISHQYCAEQAAKILAREPSGLRLVTCHLGNGCSLAAVKAGKSVDTTMGFTPLEGLMMGTRSGSVDPGILTFLMRHDGDSPAELDKLLNHKSGLLGISGISSDMREILAAAASGNKRAKLAFDIFIHRLRSSIGSMAAVLGGMDALVFTGGIGENSPEVRAAACDGFEFLGLELDPKKNASLRHDGDIAASCSAARVLVIRAGEEWAIARECWKIERNRKEKADRLPSPPGLGS